MACIPGGPAIRGTSAKHLCEQAENALHLTQWGPETQITVDTFYMDLTEVTYADYRACVDSGRCGKAGPAYSDFDHPSQPITGISWHDANQYCKSAGKHLPTEAEWEKAARGPESSDTPFARSPVTCSEAVVRDTRGRSCGRLKSGAKPHKGKVWPVASKPAGHYGLFDMVGNVEEWVADWYVPSLEVCGTPCLGHNPKGPCHGQAPCPNATLKMVKGGSWYWPASHATGWHRRPHTPKNQPYHHFGFRCAASPEQAHTLPERASTNSSEGSSDQ